MKMDKGRHNAKHLTSIREGKSDFAFQRTVYCKFNTVLLNVLIYWVFNLLRVFGRHKCGNCSRGVGGLKNLAGPNLR